METIGQHSGKMEDKIVFAATTKKSIGGGSVSHESASLLKADLVLAAAQVLDHTRACFDEALQDDEFSIRQVLK